MTKGNWQTSTRNGEIVIWRWCDCDGWEPDDAPILPGARHYRERVPNVPVEICYHRNDDTRTVTILRIRSDPEQADDEG